MVGRRRTNSRFAVCVILLNVGDASGGRLAIFKRDSNTTQLRSERTIIICAVRELFRQPLNVLQTSAFEKNDHFLYAQGKDTSHMEALAGT